MIKIGDFWGGKYDYLMDTMRYLKFRAFYGISLVSWRNSIEAIRDPKMYIKKGFVPREGDVVIDIGSQYGDYALIWEKIYKCKVYAFELAKLNFDIMNENIRINRSGITTFNIPLGDGSDARYEFNGSMATKSNSGETVKTVRLDEWIEQNKVNPYLVKIDVEGFEYEVLKGAEKLIRENKPKIIVETHSSEMRRKCDSYLKANGYVLIEEGKTVMNRKLNDVSNLFYSAN